MVKPIQRIVVVGGGTAGWLTAGVIAARHRARMEAGFSVTLIESPTVSIIGVGEGTWPTMRSTLQKMGVSETDFIRECDATFKQGAEFINWTTGEPGDRYYHPLMTPNGFEQLNLASHWLADTGDRSFCDAVTPQGELCDAGLAPKSITTPEYQAVANYAYHLDAAKFAPFIQRHCTEKLGVRHVLADVRRVEQDERGDITGLRTDNGVVEGDLFVDCTGFSSLLLGKTLGVPFRDCRDILFCDTALAVQVPYDGPDAPIASHTLSTAQSAGWIWDIGLPTRRGVGHVFSSRHISDEAAEAELRAYLGPTVQDLAVRKIPIRSGHREVFWKNNCVAVGLAAGFLEPLEASAIVLVELSAKLISEQLPACREVMDVIAARFNAVTEYRWGRIIDFLKLHYVLTKRRDSQFWVDNVDPDSVPVRLQNLLHLWEYHSPWFFDEFDRLEEVFPAASYQYVLYGMGFRTRVDPYDTMATRAQAQALMAQNSASTRRMAATLPPNRDLINRICRYGLQPI